MHLPKQLVDLFNRLAALFPQRKAAPAPANPGNTNIPYCHLVDLFRFQKDERYITEPQKQWTVRQAMGLDVQSRMAISTNFGDIRTFHADPKQVLKIAHKWESNTIMPPPPPDLVPSSPAIYGSEDQLEFGKSLIVVIRDRVTDPQQPMQNIAFGLYGFTTGDNGFRFKKLMIPAIDKADRMTGLRDVNLHDRDDVARALTYAKLCADQMFEGKDMTARLNMQKVMAMESSQLARVPWLEKKEAAPVRQP